MTLKPLLSLALGICGATASATVWFDGTSPVSVSLETPADLVIGTALEMFGSDMEAVTGRKAVTLPSRKAVINLTQLDRAGKRQRRMLEEAGVPVEALDTLTDGFNITPTPDGRLLVTGSNGRGTAYGLLELSRSAGVSPWIWWGDVVPERRSRLEWPDSLHVTKGASVEFRGIFINDEDWSLNPWSSATFEPSADGSPSGTIGPRTYKEIFKLLMRLRANAVWPAMHPCTTAFFANPENKLVADSCGIAIGTSHCEPLLRNNVGEWDESQRGRFNYITNADQVRRYWTERLDQVRSSQGGNMFTIGMRGIHDGSMEGVKTPEEKFDALQRVIDDQQQLISRHIGDPSKQMQVFVPYKEVLELYNQGLNVPPYVTLMWCDDNYGYITRLSDPDEQKRPGGAGVYYHLSYWGRPHDHLWLATTPPGLVYNEMLNAYRHNARRLWIANVHDPKTAAYPLSLFLDMAWDIDAVDGENLGEHLRSWLTQQFGSETARQIYPAMRRYYALTARRRPEFMGWSQVELDKRLYSRGLSPAADTAFSFSEFGDEADRYLEEWDDIMAQVEAASQTVRPELRDAYFAAVTYPVIAAGSHAVKMLEAQRARSLAAGGIKAERLADVTLASARSQNAYQTIRSLTQFYNDSLADGKWHGSMDMAPRGLPVFAAPSLPLLLTDAETDAALAAAPSPTRHPLDTDGAIALAAADFTGHAGSHRLTEMLGHSGRAVELSPASTLSYEISLDSLMASPLLTVALIPTQPADNGQLRFSVSVDGSTPTEFDLREAFRSEGWKQNVLRGQALRSLRLPDLAPGTHTITLTAIDPHIVADQILIDPRPSRSFYLFPTPTIVE